MWIWPGKLLLLVTSRCTEARFLLFLMFLGAQISSVRAESDILRNGVAGFVVSHIEYALAEDANVTAACPSGFNQSYSDPRHAYENLPEINIPDSATMDEKERLVRDVVKGNSAIRSYCLHPELASSSIEFRSVTGNQVPVAGIDLDGFASSPNDSLPSGSCPHVDFTSADGRVGVDNQYFRVVGCIRGYQPDGLANSFNVGQLTGAWGLLIRLSKVESLDNDSEVSVEIAANADPIRLSPQRVPLEYATYTAHSEPRFRAETSGEIIDGVLYTKPVEVRFPYDINAMYVDRVLREARLQLKIGADGNLDGYLAGYAPVEDQYDLEFGFRDARKSSAENSELGPMPLRMLSGIGRAGAMGYTCEGLYRALHEHADGHFDQDKGRCTSISTQYRITAIPAFIISASDDS